MIITIIILMMLYMAGAGSVGKTTHQIGASKCNRKVHDWEHCGHYYTGVLAGAFWPLALPLAAGMKSTEVMPTEIAKEEKAEAARRAELKKIQHEAQLEQAELMREEMLNKRIELSVKMGLNEKKLLELNAAGVDVEKIRADVDSRF